MKKIMLASSTLFLIIAVIITINLTQKNNNFKNGEIKIFCWGQYIADGTENSLSVLDEFEKENKVKIKSFNTFESCEQMYTKLKSKNCSYDIVFSSDYMVKKLIDENLIMPIEKSSLKNYENISENFKGKRWGFDKTNSYSVPYCWGHIGLIYNKKLVEKLTGEEAEKVVNGWDALWNEKLKQNILMFINAKDSFSIALKLLNKSLNTTNEEDILKAAEILKKQKPLVQAYVMDEMFDKMENNEAAISVAYSGDIVKMLKNNKNLKYCFPKQGSNIFIDAVCIPKNSKNKENALKFIDFLCREDIALENAKFLGYSTPNKKAYSNLSENFKNEISYPKKEILNKCEIYLPTPKKLTNLIETLWVKIRS